MDIQKIALDYLRSRKIMTVATCNDNIPWACTVFYAVDSNFNIYFLSGGMSRHAKEIENNKAVAVVITDSNQKVD